jgi:signal transduction histidine kinase
VTDPTARLIAATRRRLAGVTFALVALLVVGIGLATAIAGLGALDSGVDRALASTVSAVVASFDGELPHETSEGYEGTPASSDTFVLYLDAGGKVTFNPSRVGLAGMPDGTAVAAIKSGASRDLRTIRAGGVPVRLLTVPLKGRDGAAVGYLQGGFVLTLRDQQAASLVATILLVGLAGLLAAAFVTLLVTARALAPVRDSMDAQRRFVADASHELRTPVALIRANAEVLQREGLVLEGGTPLAQDIVGEADRLGRLIGDLLTLASADARGLTLNTAPLDLAALAHETARNAGALAAEGRVAIEVLTGQPVPMTGDRDRLIQLVLILLDNAISYSPNGGTVRVAVTTAGRRAEIEVIDEGPGVPTADRRRIFEAFTRLPGGRRERTRGSGLGLAIASRIAVAHGGEIAVNDAPGGGARFIVSLPLRGDPG